VNIDVGSRAFTRRLGLERFFGIMHINLKDHPVPWNTIEPLVGSIEKIHLKVPCPRVSDLHPADVAELFDELSLIERSTILKSMKSERAAQVLLECDPEVQHSIIKGLKPKRIAAIFERMTPNDIANIISDMSDAQIRPALNFMNKELAIHVQEMLSYKEGTVARYMEESFITISPDLSVGTATDYVRSLSKYPTDFYYVYAVDENDVLIGVLSLKQLIVADANTLIRDIMKTKVVSVDLNSPVEYVEELLTKYDLMSLPVVDLNGKIRGIINIDDVLDIVMDRTKNKQSFELTEEQKKDLKKKGKFKTYYSTLVKDAGQLIKDIDSVKQDR
jgi:Mg/Co/Ni transporter MgtE